MSYESHAMFQLNISRITISCESAQESDQECESVIHSFILLFKYKSAELSAGRGRTLLVLPITFKCKNVAKKETSC